MPGTLTVEELSARVGVTVRNIRAYQSQGLLPAPERSGRVAFYDEEHVARLELVRDLRAQGIGIAAIARLLEWGEGIAPAELRAFADTLMHGLLEESPVVIPPAAAMEVWGDQVTPELVERSVRTGFLRLDEDGQVVVLSPTLRAHGQELKALGLSFAEAVEVLETLHTHLDAIAAMFVDIFVERVSRPVVATEADRGAALAAMATELARMRPLATSAVNAAFRLALQRRSEEAPEAIFPPASD